MKFPSGKSYLDKKNMDYIGVDISKDSFHAYSPTLGGRKFSNTPVGFRMFKRWAGIDVHVVMEHTGVYGLRFAHRLFQWNIPTSVINSLKVYRFNQISLNRSKTDIKDAESLYNYAVSLRPPTWRAPARHLCKMRQLQSAKEQLRKQSVSAQNALKSMHFHPYIDRLAIEVLERAINFQQQIQLLDERLRQLAQKHYKPVLKSLMSIPGVGQNLALLLIMGTNAFEGFKNARQLAAFVGIAPTEHQSGTSVSRPARISRRGHGNLRSALYVYVMAAIRLQPAVKEMFHRFKKRGKPGRVAMMAISNKFLKKAFAIVRADTVYDPNHRAVGSSQPETEAN